jgi:DNA polymerase-3 subunit gamma/tau
VLGQEHVVKVLKGAIKMGNVAHAYIFAGSRGTGKTSIARILAHELGCSDNDIYEIDAASNRGIDDVRSLREGVRTMPFESKYKVYIIDEVHMLTKEAFNALLKTLEEPPAHVVFMLATTELQKVPETIISRCQTFTFKKPSETILKDLAVSVAKKEGYTLDATSAELVAMLGDGSFRDTLGIIQKVISFSKDKKIDLAEIEQVTGAPPQALVNQFIRAIAEKNIQSGFGAVKAAAAVNIDLKLYLKLILQKMRFALLLRFAPDMKKELESELSESDLAFLTEILKDKISLIKSETLNTLLEAYQAIDSSFIKELPLELALIKILQEKPEKTEK